MYETLNAQNLLAHVEYSRNRLLEAAEERRLWKALQESNGDNKKRRFTLSKIWGLLGLGQNGRLEWKL